MTLVRRIARPMLAAVFISGGIETLLHPEPRVQAADKLDLASTDLASRVNVSDNAQLVRINAGVQVGGGAALAAGRLPRLAALALAGTLVPTTAAGHRFWEEGEKPARKNQQMHFAKNVGLLGGLLLAAVDTEGRESLPRRARRGAKGAGRGAEKARLKAELTAEKGRRRAEVKAAKGRGKVAKGTAKVGSAARATR